MSQFANTFSRNIWDSNSQVFRNNVFGFDTEVSDDQSLCSGDILVNGTANYYGPGEVLAWMPLAKYDTDNDAPDDIYTVLVAQAALLLDDDTGALLPDDYGTCQSITHNLAGPVSYYGLAEIVKEQWVRECFDLALFNRDLVYDQNFAAKHFLTISPTSGPGDAFADPVISDPIFVVEPDVHSNFRAGSAIVFEPGFEADFGCAVEAVIDPMGCNMSVRSAASMTSTSVPQQKEAPRLVSTDRGFGRASQPTTKGAEVGVAVPNPTTGRFTMEFKAPLLSESYYSVYDAMGRLIRQGPLPKGIMHAEIDLSGHATGTYLIKLAGPDGVYYERIVVE